MKNWLLLVLFLPNFLFAQNNTGLKVNYEYMAYKSHEDGDILQYKKKFSFSFYNDKFLIKGDSLFNTPYDVFLIYLSKNKAYLIDDDKKIALQTSLFDFRRLIDKHEINFEKRKFGKRYNGYRCKVFYLNNEDSNVMIRQELWVTYKLGRFHEAFGYLNLLGSVFIPGIEGLVLKNEKVTTTAEGTFREVIRTVEIKDSSVECRNYSIPTNYKSELFNI